MCHILELNNAALERKIYLCNELLEIADQIAPCRSDFRGSLLLDLHEAIALQSKREFENGLMTKDNAQVNFIDLSNYTNQKIKIFIFILFFLGKIGRINEFIEGSY